MSKYTAFRCPNELLKKAKAIADGERRSLSNYIIRLLEEDAVRRAAREMRFHEQKEAGQHLYSRPYPA
jgi:hypothetical protein